MRRTVSQYIQEFETDNGQALYSLADKTVYAKFNVWGRVSDQSGQYASKYWKYNHPYLWRAPRNRKIPKI